MGFGFLKPTPGKKNDRETFRPPPLIADGGVTWKDGRPENVTAIVTDICPGEPSQSVTLHYSMAGRWRQVAMQLEAPGKPRRAVATIEQADRVNEILYYFAARAGNGLERRAPLTAPTETYRSFQSRK